MIRPEWDSSSPSTVRVRGSSGISNRRSSWYSALSGPWPVSMKPWRSGLTSSTSISASGSYARPSMATSRSRERYAPGGGCQGGVSPSRGCYISRLEVHGRRGETRHQGVSRAGSPGADRGRPGARSPGLPVVWYPVDCAVAPPAGWARLVGRIGADHAHVPRLRPARLVYRARSGAAARSDDGPARGPRLSRPEREERLRSGGRRRHTDDGHRERGAAQHYLPREARERPRGARLRERQDAQELHPDSAGRPGRGGPFSLRPDEGQDYLPIQIRDVAKNRHEKTSRNDVTQKRERPGFLPASRRFSVTFFRDASS